MLSEAHYARVLLDLGEPNAVLGREEVHAFLTALDSSGKYAGRYRSWEKGRFHEPKPAGLSAEELEALVRFHREKTSVQTGLLAFGEQPMRLNLSGPTRAAISEVTSFEVLGRAGERVPATEEEASRGQLRSLIEEAFASSAIEGAITSRKVASDLAREKRAPRTHSEQMILNNWVALRRLPEWRRSPLTPELLCEIQAVITKDTGLPPAEVGAFRTTDAVRVVDGTTGEVVHTPPPAEQLAERLARLCRFTREDQGFAPLVRAILVHHQLAFDHPFTDGNGRTARVVFLLEATRVPNLAWLQWVPLSRAIVERKHSYYQAFVDTAEERFDTTHFVRHQLRCLAIECERLVGFLTDFQRRRDHYVTKLALEDQLNDRQVALIHSALKPDSKPFTQVEHALHHQVSTMTAGRDLAQLVKWRLLAKRRDPKDKRQFLYWPTERLKGLAEAPGPQRPRLLLPESDATP